MNSDSFTAPTPKALSSLLPAFEFTDLIATHEQGAVYLAMQRSLEREVAVKILAPSISGQPEFRQSFETTARTMARLNHPNLISVYDSGFVDGMLYFVMEFVPGKSLERSSHGQVVEFNQALLLIEGTCAGLHHAHSNGIFHGALTPASILLNQNADPKIGNFGFTQPMAAGRAIASADASFTAPEARADITRADHRSDIYSVGAILYKLITGIPHSADAAAPSTLTDCPPGIDDVWRQATGQDPATRFADIPALQSALTAARKKGPAPRAAGAPENKRLALAARKPAGPAPGPAAAAPRTPATPKSAPPKVGFNWILVRNLVIIAGLLYAISLAWKNLESSRARREIENKKILAKQAEAKEKAIVEARELAEKRRNQATNPKTSDPSLPIPPVPEIVETAEESLDRLRRALARGERDEMPVGSVAIGENDYLLVNRPMSWAEAAWFAEEHGGHLAIPNAEANVTSLTKLVPDGKELWLGAGRSGRNDWTLADGQAWAPSKEPRGTGAFLIVNHHGLLRAAKQTENHPFLIQWHRDGSNPGTLATALEVTRQTLAGPKPVYPPGTKVFDDRHYLYVSRPVIWREAVDWAEKSGGHLAVASQIGEIVGLEGLTNEFTADDGIWIGGFLKDAEWVWITGEPWKSAKWMKDAVTETADSGLLIRPGKGWDAQSLSEPASGFIIEWSNDRKSSSPDTPESPAEKIDISSLQSQAAKLVAKLEDNRTKELSTNSESIEWQYDSIYRGLARSEQNAYGPHIEFIKKSVKDKRVPESIPASTGVMMTEKMAKVAADCARKQKEIDAAFLVDAEKIRSAYATRVQEALAQAKQSGQLTLANSIEDTLESATNLNSWLRSLGVEPTPENPRIPEADTSGPRYRRSDSGFPDDNDFE